MLQFLFGLFTIRWEIGRNILQCCGDKVNVFLNYAFQGAAFTYGDFLINQQAVFAFKVRKQMAEVGINSVWEILIFYILKNCVITKKQGL